jgi:hypothetical protein
MLSLLCGFDKGVIKVRGANLIYTVRFFLFNIAVDMRSINMKVSSIIIEGTGTVSSIRHWFYY